MYRLISVVGLMVLIVMYVANTTVPVVEAKPTTDKNTGITVHCKMIQEALSCDTNDRKN